MLCRFGGHVAGSVPGSSDYAGAFALLAEMTRDFAGSFDQDATLRRALGSIASYVGAEAGSLWMLEPGGSDLACVASVGPSPITGARLATSEGILGKCVRR
jgi:hypothetical protein